MRAALVPLVLIWLALHAALLALLLGIKFAGAKLVVLTVLSLAAVWLVLRRPLRLMLPHRHTV